jgi:HEAT repeat protein
MTVYPCRVYLSTFLTLMLIGVSTQHGHSRTRDDLLVRTIKCKILAPVRCPPFEALLKKGPAAMKIIVTSLKSDKQPIRAQAVRMVARRELGPPTDKSKLVLAELDTTPIAIRGEALAALGAIGAPRAIPRLRKVLASSTNARNRLFAANAVGAIRHKDTVNILAKALNDRHYSVQLAAAVNLGRLKAVGAVAALINRLVADLTSSFVRERCAQALGQIGDRRAVPALAALLVHKQNRVRQAAARGLGAIGDKTVVPALVSRLEDKDNRLAIIDALGAIGDSRAVAGLAKVTRDNLVRKRQRLRALWSMGTLGGPTLIRQVTPSLGDSDPEISRAAAEALGRAKPKAAVPMLIPLLSHSNPDVSRTALWALQQTTGQMLGANSEAWRQWWATNDPGTTP